METQTISNDTQVSEVLLIEENLSDVVLVKKALKGCKVNVKLNVVSNGAEAMDYLHQRGGYLFARVPGMVILDINLPKRSGLEILQEIKKDPLLKHVPVVVLTTSISDKDILKTYGLGATCFVTKPKGFLEFAELVCSIVDNFILLRA